jgi:hypothetical protein
METPQPSRAPWLLLGLIAVALAAAICAGIYFSRKPAHVPPQDELQPLDLTPISDAPHTKGTADPATTNISPPALQSLADAEALHRFAPANDRFILYLDLRPGRSGAFMRGMKDAGESFLGMPAQRIGIPAADVDAILVSGEEMAKNATLILRLARDYSLDEVATAIRTAEGHSTEVIETAGQKRLRVTVDTIRGIKTHVVWMIGKRVLLSTSEKRAAAASDAVAGGLSTASAKWPPAIPPDMFTGHGWAVEYDPSGAPAVLLRLRLGEAAQIDSVRVLADEAAAAAAVERSRERLVGVRKKIAAMQADSGGPGLADLGRALAGSVLYAEGHCAVTRLYLTPEAMAGLRMDVLGTLIDFLKEGVGKGG